MEYGEIIGEIQFRYFALRQLMTEKKSNAPKNGLDAMIDRACGFNQTLKNAKYAKQHVEHIIRLKEMIGDDTNSDKKALNDLSELIKELS